MFFASPTIGICAGTFFEISAGSTSMWMNLARGANSDSLPVTRSSKRAQIAALDAELERIAKTEPWSDPVAWLCCFRGIKTLTALGLLAEIGDFRRFGSARELMSFLGLTPSEYSSGEQRHRGHITKAGPRHARRLLIEAAWHYQHPPRVSQRIAAVHPHVPPDVAARAFSAQVRLHHRHRHLTSHGKRSTVANVAVARELAGFLWAAMTRQPLPAQEVTAA